MPDCNASYLVRERHFSMDIVAKIGGIAYLLGAFLDVLRLAFRTLDRVGCDSVTGLRMSRPAFRCSGGDRSKGEGWR